MKYRIVGDTMPAVEIMFDSKGESVFTQSGGMTWMSDGIAMATNTRGGLMKGIGRMFAGESLFMATYTAQRPGALIAFASTVAGQIYPLDVSATGGLICQKGAFLCVPGFRQCQYLLHEKNLLRLLWRGRLYPPGYQRPGYCVP